MILSYLWRNRNAFESAVETVLPTVTSPMLETARPCFSAVITNEVVILLLPISEFRCRSPESERVRANLQTAVLPPERSFGDIFPLSGCIDNMTFLAHDIRMVDSGVAISYIHPRVRS